MARIVRWIRERGVRFAWRFSWTGAGGDKCKICGVERRHHEKKDHRFKEA